MHTVVKRVKVLQVNRALAERPNTFLGSRKQVKKTGIVKSNILDDYKIDYIHVILWLF